ncbi:hypothetical protein BX616_001848, partial [Lobosporangium transversale]
MSSQGSHTPRTQGLQGSVGRNWRAVTAARNASLAPASASRMAGTLFYSVPTIDNDADDSDGERREDELPLRPSYMPDYDSEDDGSDS